MTIGLYGTNKITFLREKINMTWTKYNNPNKKRRSKRKVDRTDADILAAKQMIIDSKLGYQTIEKTYEEISNKMYKSNVSREV